MAFMTGLSTFMLILMVASLPFSKSSTALGFQAGTLTMGRQNKVMTQGIEFEKVDVYESNGDSVVLRSENEESERQVPTGPDPLHHNQNPSKP